MIDGVIFDKDGTLFDFRKSWGGWAAQLLVSLAKDDRHAALMASALGYDRSLQDFYPDSPVIAGTAQEIAVGLLPHLPGMTQQGLAAHMNEIAQRADMIAAVPLRPTLSVLSARGLRIGLATNDAEAPARAHLAAHGVTDLFDTIFGCDSGHGAKPDPGMLLAFAGVHALDPARVVMVGDSRHDLLAGRAAGMRTVAVLTGIAQAPELAPLADVVLADISGLAGWIVELSAA